MASLVLIVDDSESCRAMLELALEDLPGVDLLTAADGREALAAIAHYGESLRALVTDLHLPRMDGFALIAAARALPGRSSLPIIVVSGDCHPSTPDRLRRLAVDHHIVKPYSPAAVRRILERYLHAPD